MFDGLLPLFRSLCKDDGQATVKVLGDTTMDKAYGTYSSKCQSMWLDQPASSVLAKERGNVEAYQCKIQGPGLSVKNRNVTYHSIRENKHKKIRLRVHTLSPALPIPTTSRTGYREPSFSQVAQGSFSNYSPG